MARYQLWLGLRAWARSSPAAAILPVSGEVTAERCGRRDRGAVIVSCERVVVSGWGYQRMLVDEAAVTSRITAWTNHLSARLSGMNHQQLAHVGKFNDFLAISIPTRPSPTNACLPTTQATTDRPG
ncbi:hypothetical protein J6590_002690 [Homalodisca vitripennis]|nr:hypothetical protein J6590_002690 [Homalodisca vitripennis]